VLFAPRRAPERHERALSMQIEGQAIQPDVTTDAQNAVAFDQPEDADIFVFALVLIENAAEKVSARASGAKGANFQMQAPVAERLPDTFDRPVSVPGHEDFGVVVVEFKPKWFCHEDIHLHIEFADVAGGARRAPLMTSEVEISAFAEMSPIMISRRCWGSM
jgi:hypothetical protein